MTRYEQYDGRYKKFSGQQPDHGSTSRGRQPSRMPRVQARPKRPAPAPKGQPSKTKGVHSSRPGSGCLGWLFGLVLVLLPLVRRTRTTEGNPKP